MTPTPNPRKSPGSGAPGQSPVEPESQSVVAPALPAQTLADHFAQSQRARGYYGIRLVERFCREAVDRYGLWFDFMLTAPVSELDPADRSYLVATWDQYVTGERPFRRRHAR